MIRYFSRTGIPVWSMLLLLIIACLGGCRNDDQDEFEKEAFRPPNGYTETNSSGEIIGSEDPGDWNISPMFEGYVRISIPARPNPVVIGEIVRIELELLSVDFINELIVVTFIDNNPNYRKTLYYYNNTSSDGFVDLSFDPIRFSRGNVGAEAQGLNRVFIFDQNDNLITYGDVEVK